MIKEFRMLQGKHSPNATNKKSNPAFFLYGLLQLIHPPANNTYIAKIDRVNIVMPHSSPAIRTSNSQYAKAGSAIGETAIGQKYVKAVNQATDKSSDSGTVATHRK